MSEQEVSRMEYLRGKLLSRTETQAEADEYFALKNKLAREAGLADVVGGT